MFVTGSVLRIALWDCFGDAITSLLIITKLHKKRVKIRPSKQCDSSNEIKSLRRFLFYMMKFQ